MNSSTRSRFLSAVKSRLLLLSPGLANLTISDLEALKWGQKQKILFHLFENSSFFVDFFPKLLDLQERKSHVLSKLKKEMKENNSRIEIESNYRTSVVRVFLDALERYSWPPTKEAFSDPLNDLMVNNDLFLEAIDFLISLEFSSSISGQPEREYLVSNQVSSSSFSFSSSSQRPPIKQRPHPERISSVRHLNQEVSDSTAVPFGENSKSSLPPNVAASSTPRENIPVPKSKL
jgi:hypothetical protein